MAILYLRDEQRTVTDPAEITARLAEIHVQYERWTTQSSDGDVLAAYAPQIDELKKQGGYLTADVIDLQPTTPNLDTMLAKFSREHWHDEDEVRFIVAGRGIFHLHPLG